MRREVLKLLYDVRQAGRNVASFVAGRTVEDYLSDLFLRSAVERQLLIVGEAMAQLGRLDPDVCEQIPEHRKVIAFRNVLAHGYAAVDDRRVWEIIEVSLPQTVAAVEVLLPDTLA